MQQSSHTFVIYPFNEYLILPIYLIFVHFKFHLTRLQCSSVCGSCYPALYLSIFSMKGFKLSLKEISWLQVIFVLIWIKQMLIWFKLQRDGTGNGFLTSRMLFQNVCSYKFQFCTPKYVHLQGWSLKYDGWAKYKEKVPGVSDPNRNAETTCNSKLKFT